MRPHQPPALPPVSAAAAALTMATAENNNNQNNDSAKFIPPFSTAAMAAMALANSAQSQQHKSAFVPTGTGSQPSAASHAYFRTFDTPNFFGAKDLFPFPPPLFPPSFFVGFSSNPPPPTYHHTPPGLTPFSLTENNLPCLHRPCVDPLCSQCAPKVDSTDESAKEDCE